MPWNTTPEMQPQNSRGIAGVFKATVPLRNCKEVTFFSTLEVLTNDAGFLRPEDKLRIGWANDYTELLRKFEHVRTLTRKNFDAEKYRRAELPASVRRLFEECLASQFDVETVCKFASGIFSSTENFMECGSSAKIVERFVPASASERWSFRR